LPLHAKTQPTAHRLAVDLTHLEGMEVLGESLATLMSALLRLRIGPEQDGMSEMKGTLLRHEADAVIRAMARAERNSN